ncbi:hypothetical protein I7I51_05784 [Histoplasma capsulatum]|uniref:Uncharacterized protein n=1 Tax=Ajellomyces capsulatus TaxID=5037 RepID=A0A8A1M9X2_AJECA|nr:hypothetical protein I7I51_05784 [Histoplasma capsulatum]
MQAICKVRAFLRPESNNLDTAHWDENSHTVSLDIDTTAIHDVSRRRKTGSRSHASCLPSPGGCCVLLLFDVRLELLLRALSPNRGSMTKLRLPNPPFFPKDPTNNIPPHPTNPATNLAISALPAYPTSLTAPRLLGATLQAAGAVSTDLWGLLCLGLVNRTTTRYFRNRPRSSSQAPPTVSSK